MHRTTSSFGFDVLQDCSVRLDIEFPQIWVLLEQFQPLLLEVLNKLFLLLVPFEGPFLPQLLLQIAIVTVCLTIAVSGRLWVALHQTYRATCNRRDPSGRYFLDP